MTDVLKLRLQHLGNDFYVRLVMVWWCMMVMCIHW